MLLVIMHVRFSRLDLDIWILRWVRLVRLVGWIEMVFSVRLGFVRGQHTESSTLSTGWGKMAFGNGAGVAGLLDHI